MIASSWMRSRDFHEDMMKPLRAPILSRPELQALQATNQTLFDLAKPIMEKMHSLVGKTKNLISLHNPDGYMLYSCGDEYYAEMEHESSFSLGVCWHERYIGTNGITLALLEEQEKKMAFVVRGGTIQYEAGRRNLQQIIQTRDSYFTIQQRRIDQLHRLTLAQMRQYALSGQLLQVFGLAQ